MIDPRSSAKNSAQKKKKKITARQGGWAATRNAWESLATDCDWLGLGTPSANRRSPRQGIAEQMGPGCGQR